MQEDAGEPTHLVQGNTVSGWSEEHQSMYLILVIRESDHRGKFSRYKMQRYCQIPYSFLKYIITDIPALRWK